MKWRHLYPLGSNRHHQRDLYSYVIINKAMKKTLIIILILCFTLGTLILANRDLMHFEYSFLGKRIFDPELDAKRSYLLSEPFTLKPGTYELIFYGTVKGKGSSVYLARDEGGIFTGFDLADGEEEQRAGFTVSGNTENLRIGVSYDPGTSVVDVQKISVVSDSVLYKSSLLRHGTVSLFILICGILLLLRIIKPELIYRIVPPLRRHENETDFFILLLLSLFTSIPLLLPDSYGLAEDMFFHLSRIEGIAEGIKAGYFPVRNELFWLKNYGYGTGYFYPDLFLYFPVLLRLLGFSILSCYKIFVVVCTFFSLLSFYLTAKIIAKNRYAGLAAAILFGFCSYRCIAVFYRGAIGEVQAFIFMPLIILGLYYLFSGKPERWWVFALGFWGVLSSHLISLVLAAGITAVFLLFNTHMIIRDRRIFFSLLKSVLVTVMLGAGFLLPMAEQMNGNNLNMNLLVSAKRGGLTVNNINPVKNLIVFFHDWHYDEGYFRIVYPGWMLLAVPLLRVLLLFQKKKGPKAADIMLGFGIVLMICSTDLFPWQHFVWLLNRIQFTWRLLAPVSVLLPICGGIYFSELFSRPGAALFTGLLVLACAACSYPIYHDTIVNRTVSEDEFIMQDNRVAGMEYMPIGLSAEFIDKNRDTVAADPVETRITSQKRRGLSFTFTFEYAGNADTLTFTIPLIRYYGYKGTFTNSDGKTVPIEVEKSENGLALVRVKNTGSGTVQAAYHKTGFELAGEIISLVTICLGFCLFLSGRKQN